MPGDTVLLEPGDRVPADLRLEKCHNLKLDEAILTGESEAVDKTDAPVTAQAALGDQTGMAFSGTLTRNEMMVTGLSAGGRRYVSPARVTGPTGRFRHRTGGPNLPRCWPS